MLRLDATPEDVSPKLVLIEDADIGADFSIYPKKPQGTSLDAVDGILINAGQLPTRVPSGQRR